MAIMALAHRASNGNKSSGGEKQKIEIIEENENLAQQASSIGGVTTEMAK